MKKTLILFSLVGALSLPAGMAVARDAMPDKQMSTTQDQEQIYGSQLMTTEERMEYQAKMRAAKTPEDRERIRSEHHKRMQERAKDRGVTLPDEPAARGGGMGMGHEGKGMGQGGTGTR